MRCIYSPDGRDYRDKDPDESGAEATGAERPAEPAEERPGRLGQQVSRPCAWLICILEWLGLLPGCNSLRFLSCSRKEIRIHWSCEEFMLQTFLGVFSRIFVWCIVNYFSLSSKRV